MHSQQGQNDNGWHSARVVRDHLQQAHTAELSQLTDAELEKNDLFICRECGNKIFVSLTTLNNHVRSNHTESRSLNNLQLVEKYLFDDLDGNYDSEWADGLAFLRELHNQPPPFRQPLTTKIRWRLEQHVNETFLSVVEINNEALKPATHPSFRNRRAFDPWPLLQLQILFEQLVLFPVPTSERSNDQGINSIIHQRLRKFKQGKIRELYEEAHQVVSKTPKQQVESPVQIQRSAQVAADLDNFKSANARITKHAPVALINEKNLHVLEKLHPPSINHGCIKRSSTGLSTRSGGTRRKFKITPKQVLKSLSHLNRGKATGIHCDSLDLYINAAKRLNLNDNDDLRRANALAGFFSKVINGEVPDEFKHFIRQTYLVALEKDPDDKAKLRPLGVPSAIRRIAGVLILDEYAPTFAEHLLPFNFAIGVNGGVDVIIKTVQLAVDQYIIEPEQNGDLPSRALVSLDIRNMFNAVSRERLREIISERFQTLEPYADLIYDGAGETFVRLEDGKWVIIPVNEGFSQGCPASPVFAAIVLHDILSQIQPELNARAAQRKAYGDCGDDGLGSLGIIMAYVDDVNSILHHSDIKYFLDRFRELGGPLGAILNTEKTRILTTTTGNSVIDRMKTHRNIGTQMAGVALEEAVAEYSTTKVDGRVVPVEVTDGLRVLGAPIGSVEFCQKFILKALDRAKSDAAKLLTNLDDLQTTLRLFSMCTANKVTHLFAHDVYNTSPDDLPENLWLWDSNLTNEFSTMTADLLANITNKHDLPAHSQLISNISINEGGLGIQNPRTNAITAYMTTTKRCLQYAHDGVWLGFNKPKPCLPPSIKLLYSNWTTSQNRTWQIFNKYLPTCTTIARNEPTTAHDYVFKASLNGTREKMKEYCARQLKHKALYSEEVSPPEVIELLPAIMDKRTSMALMTMSRINESHRIKNATFRTALQRKLRIPIFDSNIQYKCRCGTIIDVYGDHCLGCKVNHKGKASNGIRDEITKVLQRVLPIVNMIDSPTQVEKELHNIVPSLPSLKPFDLSVRLDHSLETGQWRVPYTRIGFDVTLIHSTNPSCSSPSEVAQYNETDLRLRDGEKMKFARRTGGTNPISNITLTADQVIGEILDSNNVFIPIAVGPFGELGTLFRRFIENCRVLPLPTFSPERVNAKRAAERATNNRTPYDVLTKADRAWRKKHGHTLFDGSYLSQLPSTWANQRIGLATATHLANHINTSLTKIQPSADGNTGDSNSQSGDALSQELPDWKFYEGDMGNTTHLIGQDDLVDNLFNVEDDVYGSSVNPNRRGVR